jgi:fructose-1,6-bisphosphatase I
MEERCTSQGNFVVMMDPIDGSSNVDVAISIGSIFGIWRHSGNYNDDILKPGNQLVAASYTIYGSSTIMVVATKNQVSSFTLDPRDDTFWLTKRDLKLPNDGAYYSVNEGYFNRWPQNMQDAVASLGTLCL